MKKQKHIVLGVHITERLVHVPQVQGLLSEYGCNIKTRIGLHEVSDNACSPNGLLLLEMVGDESKSYDLQNKLNAIEGVEVKAIEFEHM